VTLFDFLSLKNDVNVASKSKKQKKSVWLKECAKFSPFLIKTKIEAPSM
jgi:hypothetical protein